MKITLDSFRDVIRQSGLVDDDVLDAESANFDRLVVEQTAAAADAASAPKADAKTFALYLLEKKVLSRWQAENLLKGKHKGFRLGKYRLISLLGKGGMSSVYLAEHTVMKRRVAIKVLPHKKVNDASYLGRFHREAQAVAALDHPNIVRAYDVDAEMDGSMEIHFLVMEYVEGMSLQQLVAAKGVVAPKDAADYIRQSAEGLEHAHVAGLVHRDIKPGNLLLDKNGIVRLLDLGLARFFNDEENSLTVEHDEKVLGTADYLAPEQAVDSHTVDHRADLYALGCTLFFLLTGEPPFNQGTLAQRLIAHQTKEPPSLSEKRKDVPASLDALMKRLMAKKPEGRPDTAAMAAQEFADWLAEQDAQPTTSQQPTSQPSENVSEAFGSFLNQLDSEPTLASQIDVSSGSAVGPLGDSNVIGKTKPTGAAVAQSSNIHGRGPSSLTLGKEKSSSIPVLAGGGAAAVLVLVVIGWLLFGGGDETPTPSPNNGTAIVEVTPAAVSRPSVEGNIITVGTSGNFATVGEAVQYVSDTFTPFDDSESRTISLAGGETFRESINLDSSGFDVFPRFVTIRSDENNPATLLGDGQNPVVSLTAVDRLTIEHLVIDGANAPVAVSMSGYMGRTRFHRVTIKNFTSTGIDAAGLAGLSNERVAFAWVTVQANDQRPARSGIKLTSAIPETSDIEFDHCRFQGPMTAGIEFVGPFKNVWVRRSIFESLDNGLLFPGPPANFERIQLIGNTFHNVKSGVRFAEQPAKTSSKFALSQNLFSDVEKEFVVGSGLKRDEIDSLFKNGGWRGENFTTREKKPPADNEFRVIADEGYKVDDADFASTNRDEPGYLRPRAERFKTANGGPDPKYIGAVRPAE